MSTHDTQVKSSGALPAATSNGRRLTDPALEAGWDEPLTLTGEARYSQSLERGLAILECFTPERPLQGIAELADALGMSRSTTHRYVITLVALGYLRQGERRKYRLALRVTGLGLAAMSSTSLREHARPHIEELGRRCGYTVGVAVLDGPEILCVDRVGGRRRGQRAVDLRLAKLSRLPAHRTAAGKLLLAYLPPPEQRELMSGLQPVRGGASKKALRSELEAIPLEGLACSDGELVPGLLAIAAPVRSESREVVAAAGMAAHSSTISLQGLLTELGPHLISTADRISARLGYRRDDEYPG